MVGSMSRSVSTPELGQMEVKEMAGYLWKRSKSHPNRWLRRFFRLTESELTYHHSPSPTSPPKLILPISSITRVTTAPRPSIPGVGGSVFTIQSAGNQILELAARNAERMDEWVRAVKAAAGLGVQRRGQHKRIGRRFADEEGSEEYLNLVSQIQSQDDVTATVGPTSTSTTTLSRDRTGLPPLPSFGLGNANNPLGLTLDLPFDSQHSPTSSTTRRQTIPTTPKSTLSTVIPPSPSRRPLPALDQPFSLPDLPARIPPCYDMSVEDKKPGDRTSDATITTKMGDVRDPFEDAASALSANSFTQEAARPDLNPSAFSTFASRKTVNGALSPEALDDLIEKMFLEASLRPPSSSGTGNLHGATMQTTKAGHVVPVQQVATTMKSTPSLFRTPRPRTKSDPHHLQQQQEQQHPVVPPMPVLTHIMPPQLGVPSSSTTTKTNTAVVTDVKGSQQPKTPRSGFDKSKSTPNLVDLSTPPDPNQPPKPPTQAMSSFGGHAAPNGTLRHRSSNNNLLSKSSILLAAASTAPSSLTREKATTAPSSPLILRSAQSTRNVAEGGIRKVRPIYRFKGAEDLEAIVVGLTEIQRDLKVEAEKEKEQGDRELVVAIAQKQKEMYIQPPPIPPKDVNVSSSRERNSSRDSNATTLTRTDSVRSQMTSPPPVEPLPAVPESPVSSSQPTLLNVTPTTTTGGLTVAPVAPPRRTSLSVMLPPAGSTQLSLGDTTMVDSQQGGGDQGHADILEKLTSINNHPLAPPSPLAERTPILVKAITILQTGTCLHGRLSLLSPANPHTHPHLLAALIKARRKALDEYRTAIEDLGRRTRDYVKCLNISGATGAAAVDLVESIEVMLMKVAQVREVFGAEVLV
ncbi:hypothetical protein DFS34DRAFT_248490 [Phlyctochytrium arcticum]|nr:hypothetical protein DFS34DRAFT_248490 [Phlyctochytrium arcticum]